MIHARVDIQSVFVFASRIGIYPRATDFEILLEYGDRMTGTFRVFCRT